MYKSISLSLALFTAFAILFYACKKDKPEEPTPTSSNQTGTLTDPRDGQVYTTVLIGNQWWMAENLNIGTQVPPSGNQTNDGIIEKYCHGEVNSSNTEGDCSVWGGLYQWDEMMQYVTTEVNQGICPNGWHIPTDAEWDYYGRGAGDV